MKNLCLVLALLITSYSNAQNFQETIQISGGVPALNTPPSDRIYSITLDQNLRNVYVALLGVAGYDDIRFSKLELDGSVYLFDDWENKGVIEVGKKRYTFSNINFNIKEGEFMSKIEGDSTFIFDILSIDKLYVNGRQFKSFYSSQENKNKVYEVLYEDEMLSLIKGYYVSFIEASPNPMVNRPRNKIKRGRNYFIYKNGTLLPFKLNKSYTLSIAGNDQKKKLEKYIKNNDLAYRKEKDVVKIFEHLSEL